MTTGLEFNKCTVSESAYSIVSLASNNYVPIGVRHCLLILRSQTTRVTSAFFLFSFIKRNNKTFRTKILYNFLILFNSSSLSPRRLNSGHPVRIGYVHPTRTRRTFKADLFENKASNENKKNSDSLVGTPYIFPLTGACHFRSLTEYTCTSFLQFPSSSIKVSRDRSILVSLFFQLSFNYSFNLQIVNC